MYVQITVEGYGHDPEPNHDDVINMLKETTKHRFSVDRDNGMTVWTGNLDDSDWEDVRTTFKVVDDEVYDGRFVVDNQIPAWYGWYGWDSIVIEFNDGK